jgi:site-specific DNA-methyltransferase (adenine-specific)
LKPAHEPIVVARKPLRGSVAETVLEYGTGALNIDATRIPMTDQDRLTIDEMGGYGEAGWRENDPDRVIYGHGLDDRAERARAHAAGRFPANVVLGHSPDCKPVGTRKVRGSQTRERSPDPPAQATWGLDREGGEQVGYADEDGFETITAWECAPGCAVAALDAQSGDLKAGGRPGSRAGVVLEEPATRLAGGGASRFFYTAKASTRERNKGLAHLPELFAPTMGDGIGAVPHNPDTARRKANTHPTVKPLDLMHWLVRLVAPPGGVILDPFAGSGTTGVACRLEHVRCILIEADAEYLPIIAGRLGVQATPEGEMRLERTRIPDPEPRKAGRRFACPHCDLAFTDRSLYARHWRSTHDPRRPPTDEGDDDARTD